MKAFQPYLNFDGTTREAMTFYHQCLGGDFQISSFAESGAPMPPGSEERTMHASITRGSAVLMASDTMPGMPFTAGNNVHVSIDCESAEEIDRVFNALGDGGTIRMPLQDTFWGARFGMLTDRFGINWMCNYDLPKNG